MLGILERRAPELEYILVDTPGRCIGVDQSVVERPPESPLPAYL